MKHSPTAPSEEVKLNPFEALSEIDARDILHIITDGKCKIPTQSNFTKVQLPRGNHKPIDINVCNKISIEPSKKIKILVHLNASLWLLTTLLFSISLGVIYIELQTQKQNVYELSQTLLTVTSKYEFLSDSLTQSLSANEFNSHENIHDNQTKDNTAHSDNNYGKINTDKYSSETNVSGNKKGLDGKNEEPEKYNINTANHTDGSIAYRKNQQNPHILGGPAVIQFKGALPRVDITRGLIGPWTTDDVGSSVYNLTEFYITENGNAIEIAQSGLYTIYAQVSYETSSLLNSFSISIRKRGGDALFPVAYCSATAQNSSNGLLHECSCFTSVVRHLSQYDRVLLQQQQINRRVIMSNGYSFIGLVRLNSDFNTHIRNNKRKS